MNAQVKASQAALKAMHRVHLQRFMPELGELEAYTDIMYLVERGIAYHHGGMLPVLSNPTPTPTPAPTPNQAYYPHSYPLPYITRHATRAA